MKTEWQNSRKQIVLLQRYSQNRLDDGYVHIHITKTREKEREIKEGLSSIFNFSKNLFINIEKMRGSWGNKMNYSIIESERLDEVT